MPDGIPNFLDVVRMYRKERGMSFEGAKQEAIKAFDKKGWSHPYARKTIPSQTQNGSEAWAQSENVKLATLPTPR